MVDPCKVKLFESCIEAPFQLTLQLFVVMSGKWPRPIAILSMVASLMSIVLNVLIGNEFGNSMDMCSMIMLRIKLIPMVLVSTLFRSLSLVTMAIYLRLYALVPIAVMFIVQIGIANKFRFAQKDLRYWGKISMFLLIEYKIMSLISGQIFQVGGKATTTTNIHQKMQKSRIMLFLVDSLFTLLVYGLGLVAVMVLWENTNLLSENLSPCAFDIMKYNVNMICGTLIGLGFISCIFCYLYRFIEPTYIKAKNQDLRSGKEPLFRTAISRAPQIRHAFKNTHFVAQTSTQI